MKDSHPRVRLRPRSDFQPFLGFLNEAILSTRGSADAGIEKQVEKRSRSRKLSTLSSSQRRRQPLEEMERLLTHIELIERRAAVETAARRRGESLYAQEQRNLGSAIIRAFIRPLEARGYDYARSMMAWRDLWWFLTSEHPQIVGRFGQCDWCGRFFYRYTRKTKTCSALCRVAPSLVKNPNSKLAGRMRKIVLPFVELSRKRPSTPTLTRVSEFVVPQFLGVINLRHGREFVFPKDVSNPDAFVEMWEFLFRDVDTLHGRMRRCEECQGLFYAYHQSHQGTCGRKCQMIRYRSRQRVRRRRGTRAKRSAGRSRKK